MYPPHGGSGYPPPHGHIPGPHPPHRLPHPPPGPHPGTVPVPFGHSSGFGPRPPMPPPTRDVHITAAAHTYAHPSPHGELPGARGEDSSMSAVRDDRSTQVQVKMGEGMAPVTMTKEYAMRSVVVRNLPPDASQTELQDICSKIGAVIKVRLVFDRQTGESKGIGHCEFADASLAGMAVRKLDGSEFRGRQLIVRKPEFANSRDSEKAAAKAAMRTAKRTVDEITRAVGKLTKKQKQQILSEMKALILKNEQSAKELLVERPQLAQALLLIQMELGLIEAADVKALTDEVRPRHVATDTPKKSAAVSAPTTAGISAMATATLPAVAGASVTGTVAMAVDSSAKSGAVSCVPPSTSSADGQMEAVHKVLVQLKTEHKRVFAHCLTTDEMEWPSDVPPTILKLAVKLKKFPPHLLDRLLASLSSRLL